MKTLKKLSLVVLVAVLSAGVVNAQSGIGLEGGYSLSHTGGKNSSGSLSGIYVGPTYDMTIQGPVGLHFGLLYNLGMDSEETLGIKSKYQWHTLDIPVRAKFTFPIGYDIKVSAFAGPNFNIGLANTTSVGDIKTDLYNVDLDNNGKSDFSRFNVQLGFGAAVQYKIFGVKASYDFGMIDLYKNIDSKFNGFKLGLFMSL